MYSMGIFFKLTCRFALFFGIVFCVASNESHRKCFDVESETICYFLPNVSAVDWDTAWKTCKELDATLPVIHSKKHQKIFKGYLSGHVPGQSVWTAGRFVGSEWTWLNGQEFLENGKPPCPYNPKPCPHETQAVLTKELKYAARFPNDSYAYICSFPGVSCQENEQNKSMSWKGGCLNWTTSHKQQLNKARHECLKREGDLAIFNEDGDLQKFKNLSPFKQHASAEQYWIGLHRKRWIWNATDLRDIKYNLLDDYGDEGKDCLFIDQHLSWKRVKCSEKRQTVCQKAVDNGKGKINKGPEYPHFSASFVIAIVIGGMVAAIAVMVLLILIRKRRRAAKTMLDAGSPITKPDHAATCTPSQKTVVPYQDDIYATIDESLINLNCDISPIQSTSPHIKGESNNALTFVYSVVADFSNSVTDIPTAVYSEPYSSSALIPVTKNQVD